MNTKVNENGVNANIKVHVLNEDKMRELGFTDFREGYWYYCKAVGGKDITFNLSINKVNAEDFRLDVLDEGFLQPYDYQYYLERNPEHQFAIQVRDNVEEQMGILQAAGVLSGHVKGEYI